MSRKQTDYIIVHCSATKPDMDIGRETIKNWHVKGRGWRDIGYNFVIKRDGTRQSGRDLNKDGKSFDEIGAHTMGYNSRSIGICLVGGIDYTGKADANFTKEQYKELEVLIKELLVSYPEAKIKGHRNFANKACPSFDVESWWYGQ